MFRKLRNGFLIINMTIISIVMLFAFSVIYISTYNNVKIENQRKLNEAIPLISDRIPGISGLEFSEVRIIPRDFQLSFSLVMNEDGKITRIHSFIDMDEEEYISLGNIAFKERKSYSTIKINGREWMYRIASTEWRTAIGYNSWEATGRNDIQIIFLDITESSSTLNQLLATLTLVGLIMLLIIFAISWYFANKSIKPIAEAWNKQRQFVADASHELKTPLTIINANTEAMLANGKDTVDKQSKWIGYIQDETNRMGKLVNDLLYLARAEDMAAKIEHVPFNISDIVNETVISMEAVIYEKNIDLNVSIEDGLIINGDSAKFKQVIMILLDNAIKYTEIPGTIDVELKKGNKKAYLSVTNTGKGISEKNLPRIFDRFYREDKVRNSEDKSYGLGLSIAKTVVERMGGKISVRSDEKNTIFTIILKLK